MSIVGTRPPLISETNLYEPRHKARLAIKPGITGMWQVSGRSDITDFEEVVRLDKEFYATSFDSIALTASCYSYKKLEEGEQPNRLIQLMWCILLILLPMALIFAESSMNNLQSVSIVAAFPIAIVIILIIASFLKDAGKYMDEK